MKPLLVRPAALLARAAARRCRGAGVSAATRGCVSVRLLSGAAGGEKAGEDATETHFGFKTVRSDEKAKLVEQVFSTVGAFLQTSTSEIAGGLTSHRACSQQVRCDERLYECGPPPAVEG